MQTEKYFKSRLNELRIKDFINIINDADDPVLGDIIESVFFEGMSDNLSPCERDLLIEELIEEYGLQEGPFGKWRDYQKSKEKDDILYRDVKDIFGDVWEKEKQMGQDVAHQMGQAGARVGSEIKNKAGTFGSTVKNKVRDNFKKPPDYQETRKGVYSSAREIFRKVADEEGIVGMLIGKETRENIDSVASGVSKTKEQAGKLIDKIIHSRGLKIAGVVTASAFALYIFYAVYKIFVYGSCKSLRGYELKTCKIKTLEEAIELLKEKKQYCKHTKDPKKCGEKIDKSILKFEKKMVKVSL